MEDKACRIKGILNSSLAYSSPKLISQATPFGKSGSLTSPPGAHGKQHSLSKDNFFKRLDTYSPRTWFAKPHDLSPLYCARYGWENRDVDMLRCVSCHMLVCGSLPKNTSEELQQDALSRLKDRLVSAHKDSCPWKQCPSPEYYTDDSMDCKSDAIKKYVLRLSTLASHAMLLPARVVIVTDSGSNDSISETVTCAANRLLADESTCSDSGGRMPPQAPVDATVALLATTGWSAASTTAGSSARVLHCSLCRRTVGLWQRPSHDVCSATSAKSHASNAAALATEPEQDVALPCHNEGAVVEVHAVTNSMTGTSSGQQSVTNGTTGTSSGKQSDQPPIKSHCNDHDGPLVFDNTLVEKKECLAVSETVTNEQNSSTNTSTDTDGQVNLATSSIQFETRRNSTVAGTHSDVSVDSATPVLRGSEQQRSALPTRSEDDSSHIPAEQRFQQDDNSEDGDSSAKKRRLETTDEAPSPSGLQSAAAAGVFHTLQEHRTWCPWVCSPKPSIAPLWKVLHGHLTSYLVLSSPNACMTQTASSRMTLAADGMRNIRKLMKDWTGQD